MATELGNWLDFAGAERIQWNLGTAALYEAALRRQEGVLAAEGPLVCQTGAFTGRSPNDKFVVRELSTARHIDWGTVNRPMTEASFEVLYRDVRTHIRDKELFALDAWAGTDPAFTMPIRVVTELAWHNLFARNMFLPETDPDRRRSHAPAFTVLDVPSFAADPARHGTRSSACIVIHFRRKLVLIGGTQYAGEIKKAIFTILNYILPALGVLPMHCSANIGRTNDAALFFGLSGTGKTTLSSDPERRLVGDDEHGWGDAGVFNFEGGCYAKVIQLSAAAEPQIYATTRRFGTVLENVVLDGQSRTPNLDDASLTENTRASYPIGFIDNAEPGGRAWHPTNIVMLTADAYGVLPPIARLSPDGAMYHFLSGYTARVAGTERGATEPSATFSACFGAPFLPRSPQVYATMLGQKIARHAVRVWLVNTGWTGGAYGIGHRMTLGHTRAMIAAALAGALDAVGYRRHPVFNVDVPTSCAGVPANVLDPRSTWSDPARYDAQARALAGLFSDNFRAFEGDVAAAVRAAGPSA
jgi:phosphoenolpyruvate carboxykinase (ATP)